MPVGLTKRQIEAAKVAAHEYTLWDDNPPAFGVRIRPGGSRTFILKYRVDGRQRKLTLGSYGALTVEQARKLAKTALASAAAGTDPAQAKLEARRAPTMKDLCDRFESEYIAVRLKPKTARSYRRLMETRIAKHFGPMKIGAVTRADVAKWHQSLKATPVEANRALLLLHRLFVMAGVWGLYEGANPANAVEKYGEKARKRYLQGNELYRISNAISELEAAPKRPLSPFVGLAFRLLIATGCRRDEVLTLKWEDVDLDAMVLRLKDSKTGEKTVVLSSFAVDLLKHADTQDGSPWVCTRKRRNSKREWSHIVNPASAWQDVKERASAHVEGEPDVDVMDVTLHDLRHAYASVGVSMGLSLPIVGALLGHADQASTQRYSHLQVDPLRLAAERIGGEIAAAMAGTPPAQVVNMEEARQAR
ncbi:MAG TPA: site-specific integrase [Chloroflexota bacterium]|nr:site-specific integrase [Chloroflexota bacterium]